MSSVRDLPISLDRDAIAAFCRRHHIRKLSLFGSVLTDRFTDESDVDMLVEFEREHVPGLFRFVRMEEELSQIVERKVDLRTAEDLSRYFREEVVAGAEAVYAP